MTEARSCETQFGPDLAGVKSGRHFVRDAMLRWGLPSLVDDASLGVSELIANAVKHAGTGFAVRVDVGDEVVVTVVDGRTAMDSPTAAEAAEESGRGLTIVRAIAADWGVTEVVGGKAVWFSLPLPDENAVDADMFDLDERRAAHEHHQATGTSDGAVQARVGSAV